MVMVAERPAWTRRVFLLAIGLIAAAHMALALSGPVLAGAALGLLLFFTGFNALEASLPALVTRAAPAAQKGTAVGVYSASQFLGAFAGGLGAGVLDALGGPPLVFAALGAVAAAWLIASLPMRVPPPVRTRLVPVDPGGADAAARELAALPGVEEAVVVAAERVAYLKIDPERFDPADLERAGYATGEEDPDGGAAEAVAVR